MLQAGFGPREGKVLHFRFRSVGAPGVSNLGPNLASKRALGDQGSRLLPTY